jgi:hypothetical protein
MPDNVSLKAKALPWKKSAGDLALNSPASSLPHHENLRRHQRPHLRHRQRKRREQGSAGEVGEVKERK